VEQSKANKTNGFWYGFLKLLIAAAAFIFIYRQVIRRENFSTIVDEYRSLLRSNGAKPAFILVLLLMLANWSLEALKWKWMMRKLERIPFGRALAAIFSGLTVSFFTPNRIGEYVGRVFHLRSADRIKATFVTILENLSQLIITIVVGSISLVFYLNRYSGLHEYILWAIGVLMIVFSATVLLLFFEVPLLDRSILRIKRIGKLSRYLEVLGEYKKPELLVLLLLASLRYLVFTLQFILLLRIFGIDAGYALSMLLVSMTFFVMTIVPTFALTEIGVRGAIASYFIGKVSVDTIAILNATVSLWLINLVIPALAGIVFIFQFRFRQQRR
jgi:hypothetical protein